ncbi:MAG: hypothetical protein JOS17DRAFT_354802 [Linnemannia elongata]|nr:MAG: hypothetical protein JOS17DRAFT_354802 [Linnemannia elongata]
MERKGVSVCERGEEAKGEMGKRRNGWMEGERGRKRDRGQTERETRHTLTGMTHSSRIVFGCDALALKCSNGSTLPQQQNPIVHRGGLTTTTKKIRRMAGMQKFFLAAGPLLFFILVTFPLLLCDLYSFSAACFLVCRSLDSLSIRYPLLPPFFLSKRPKKK